MAIRDEAAPTLPGDRRGDNAHSTPYFAVKWSYKLGRLGRIELADGRGLATLGEARDLIRSLPEAQQRSAHWQYAGELLVKAADRGEKYAIMDARAQLTRALKTDGLVS